MAKKTYPKSKADVEKHKRKTAERVRAHRALKKAQGQKVQWLEPWVPEALEALRSHFGFRNFSEVLSADLAPGEDGVIDPLPMKDKFQTHYVPRDQKIKVTLTLTRGEWNQLHQAYCSSGEVIERLMLERYEMVNGRLVLMVEDKPVVLREMPAWVPNDHYPRMTKNDDHVCEDKHEFRRYQRELKISKHRKRDPYDPGHKLDEANGVDDPRLARLPDYGMLFDEQNGELQTMADGTRYQFGKMKSRETAYSAPLNDQQKQLADLEAQRYANEQRALGTLKKASLTYAEQQAALYTEANTEGWQVDLSKPSEAQEPCPTCEQPYEVDQSGYCTNCHDQIRSAS